MKHVWRTLRTKVADGDGKAQGKGNWSILAGMRCYGPPERRSLTWRVEAFGAARGRRPALRHVGKAEGRMQSAE